MRSRIARKQSTSDERMQPALVEANNHWRATQEQPQTFRVRPKQSMRVYKLGRAESIFVYSSFSFLLLAYRDEAHGKAHKGTKWNML